MPSCCFSNVEVFVRKINCLGKSGIRYFEVRLGRRWFIQSSGTRDPRSYSPSVVAGVVWLHGPFTERISHLWNRRKTTVSNCISATSTLERENRFDTAVCCSSSLSWRNVVRQCFENLAEIRRFCGQYFALDNAVWTRAWWTSHRKSIADARWKFKLYSSWKVYVFYPPPK